MYHHKILIIATIIITSALVPHIQAMDMVQNQEEQIYIATFGLEEQANKPLIQAVMDNDFYIAQRLLAYCRPDPNIKLPDLTPLVSLAASNKKADIVNLLLVGGADPNAQSKSGLTPLHFATLKYHQRTIRMLLRHPRIDINIEDKAGQTPLSCLLLFAHEAFEERGTIPDNIISCFKMLWQDTRTNPAAVYRLLSKYSLMRQASFQKHLPILATIKGTHGATALKQIVDQAQEALQSLGKIPADVGFCFTTLWHNAHVDRTVLDDIFGQNRALQKALFRYLVSNRTTPK